MKTENSNKIDDVESISFEKIIQEELESIRKLHVDKAARWIRR